MTRLTFKLTADDEGGEIEYVGELVVSTKMEVGHEVFAEPSSEDGGIMYIKFKLMKKEEL